MTEIQLTYISAPAEHVTADVCAQIRAYLDSLLSRSSVLGLDPQFVVELQEAIKNILPVNESYADPVARASLATISADIRRCGKVDKVPLIAAAATVGEADQLDEDQTRIAERWLLLCVGAFSRLHQNKKDRSSARKGFRDLRLIVERDPSILAVLPVIARPMLISKRDRGLMDERGRASILTLIADACSLPDPRSFDRSKRESTSKPKSSWEGDASALYDDADVDTYSFATPKLKSRIRKTGVAALEVRLDGVSSSVTAAVAEKTGAPSTSVVQSGSTVSRGGILASRARKASRSPCDPSCLTPSAVILVVGHAFADSMEGNQAATFTLLSLLLGRDHQFWERCFQAKSVRKGLRDNFVLHDQQFFLRVDIKTPAPLGDPQWFEADGEVRIPVPKEMTAPLNTLFESVADIEQFRALVEGARVWLRKTTLKAHSAADLQKVSRFLRFYLSNECRDRAFPENQNVPLDEAVISTILGGPLTVPPQILYSRVSQKSIDDVFNQYWTRLSHNTTARFTGLEGAKKTAVGSRGCLNHDIVKQHFCRIRIGFTDCDAEFISRFNSFAIYIYEVFVLSVAWRAVDERGWSRKAFDLNSGLALINDKMVRGAASGRLVKMPEILRLLLVQWTECLQWVSRTYSAIDLEIRDAAQSALDGRGIGRCSSAFLFIIERGRDDKPYKKTLTNAHIRQLYAQDFNVRPNWGRHFIRTKLRGLGVNSALVDSVLGHEFRGSLPTQQYSVLPMKALDQVADVCNTVLLDLGVGVPQIVFDEYSCCWVERNGQP
jgi:hypothetical protein